MKVKTYTTCDSRVVPHRSTEQAQWCLTSEFGWDPVLSPWYDRMMGDDRWGPTPIATHPPPMPKRSTSSGDRTHDHKIKSLALYHLSYGGPLDDNLHTGHRTEPRTQPNPAPPKNVLTPGIEPGTLCV